MNNTQFFATFLIFTVVVSCKPIPIEVKLILDKSQSNRAELEKVIDHYIILGEKKKLEAAYFLIKNIEGKYSEYYSYNEKAYEIFYQGKMPKIDRVKYNREMNQIIDSLKTTNLSSPLVIYDIEVITANYLIENIDLAFEAWKEPWAQHFSFYEFCEYVLPYRIANEPLSNWRRELYQKYKWVKDSVSNIKDTREVVLYLNDLVGMDFWVEDFLELPYVPITLLDKVKAGGCNQRYLLMISILRAMGIPAMLDHAPLQNNTYKAHSWTVYINSEHKYCPFDGGRPRRKLFELDNLPHAFLDSMMIPLADGFGSNVFRYTFSNNKDCLGARTKDWSSIPLLFRTEGIKDVTKDYLFDQVKDLKYTFDSKECHITDSIVYLSVFGYGQNIREADWAKVIDNQVCFSHIGTEAVYLISMYRNKSLVPISYPILLHDSIKTILIPDLNNLQKLVLTRKSNVSLLMQGYANAMIGSIFEGSNDPDFKDSDILYRIESAPTFMEEGQVNTTKKYRYVRYYSPEKDIRVAELEFWGEDKLRGKPISYIIKDSISSDSDPNKCLDDDIRTNFNALRGSWVGLDLGSSKRINKVKYLPRNNFNVIERNNDYELLYYDKGWHSLGIKKGDNQYIEFENVPSNSLFLLKNITQGIEERIFTYSQGVQHWW